VVLSAIDQPGTKKSAHEGNAYIREPAICEYEMKVFSSDEIIDIKETTDLQFDLHNLFPNPFSEKVAINFEIPKDEKVIIEIYDMQGRLVRELLNEIYPPGKHCVYWKGKDDSGYRVLPGIYFCHFKAGKYNISKSIVYYQ
jgi:flagellar hook assembly protein FlgD